MNRQLPLQPSGEHPSLTDPYDHPYRSSPAPEVVTADGRSLPLISAKLEGIAEGGVARLVLEQRFENRFPDALHVTYRMPLPPDGAVSGYAFAIAGRRIVGHVQPRQVARAYFERAIAYGHTAALLEQDRADIFTQQIGNLPPGAPLIAQIAIDQRLVWLADGEWELRFPTVIGPRYASATDRPAEARSARVETTADDLATRVQISIRIRDAITRGRAPGSPSHALTTDRDGRVVLRALAGAPLDRDIVVRWPVAQAQIATSLATVRPEPRRREPDDAGGLPQRVAEPAECFGALTIVPPATGAPVRAFPRDVAFLIDTSGSMTGRPLDKAKQVLALVIESLGDDDRLELVAFSSQPYRYKPEPVAATRREKRAAIDWLRGLSAESGSEMGPAIVEALRSKRTGAQRQIVVASDGYISGESSVIGKLIDGLHALGRLHFLGIGSSVNRGLATAMARAGRGAEVVCDLDDDPERAARRLIDRTRSPVLTDVRLHGSALIESAPARLPDVYAGSPAVVALRLRPGDLFVHASSPHGGWGCRLEVHFPRLGDGNPALITLFGREQVADLEARRMAGEWLDDSIELAGLEFQIATRMTSFVAVDADRVNLPATRHEVIPQSLPYGTTAAAFGLRSAEDGDDGEEAPPRKTVMMSLMDTPQSQRKRHRHRTAALVEMYPPREFAGPTGSRPIGASATWTPAAPAAPPEHTEAPEAPERTEHPERHERHEHSERAGFGALIRLGAILGRGWRPRTGLRVDRAWPILVVVVAAVILAGIAWWLVR